VATGARDPVLIAATSIGFGLALGLADWRGTRRRDLGGLRLADAVWIGLAQAVALVPGTSRSGITVTAALALGFARPAAARFSLLLSIPVGVLAGGWDLVEVASGGVAPADLAPMGVGLAVAGVSAYLAIGWLLAWLARRTTAVFVVYRVALGVAVLALVA
jgi:undecaprenyl-diphosphatase